MPDSCDNNPQLQSVLNKSATDKFLLALELPRILKKRSAEDSLLSIDKLQMSVHGTIVPAVNVPAVELRYAGQSINVSSYSRPNYPPLRLNFTVDNSYLNYYIIWKWLDLLNTAKESLYDGTPIKQTSNKDLIEDGLNAEYQTTFSLLGMNEYNQATVEFTYSNAFPINLGGIEFSYRTNDPIESTVEFQFGQLDMKLVN